MNKVVTFYEDWSGHTVLSVSDSKAQAQAKFPSDFLNALTVSDDDTDLICVQADLTPKELDLLNQSLAGKIKDNSAQQNKFNGLMDDLYFHRGTVLVDVNPPDEVMDFCAKIGITFDDYTDDPDKYDERLKSYVKQLF